MIMTHRSMPISTRPLILCIFLISALPHVTPLATIPLIKLRLSNSAAPIPIRTTSSASTLRRRYQISSTKHTPHQFLHVSRHSTSLRNDLQDEVERAARRRADENRARGGGTGEAVGGAILGGLLGGPFGALFGAQIGASFGSASQLDKARQDEMKRKGLSPEMLDQATEIGVALKQAVEGLQATQESAATSQQLAKSLDRQEKLIYERAKSTMASGDETGARKLLLERESLKGKLLKVLLSLAEDRKRLTIAERNVEALQTRALEIESLLRRSVGAASLQDSANIGLSLEPEDPLLQKFRDRGM